MSRIPAHLFMFIELAQAKLLAFVHHDVASTSRTTDRCLERFRGGDQVGGCDRVQRSRGLLVHFHDEIVKLVAGVVKVALIQAADGIVQGMEQSIRLACLESLIIH